MRGILDKIFENKKITISIPIFISLFLYLLFILFGTGEEKNNMVLLLPLMGVFWYFGVFFVIYLQIKNPFCPEKFLNFFELVATLFFGIGSICYVIIFFVSKMQIYSGIMAPIVCLTFSAISFAHSKRTKI